jgi:hypothetical protein
MKQFFKTNFNINRILLIVCVIGLISNIIKIQESKKLCKQTMVYSKRIQRLDTIVKNFNCEVDTFQIKVNEFSIHAKKYLKAVSK